ncbi:uncharacterized protein LOC127009298 [Eriocheir sinensis]|uniref:uncharacterized protein LOC127009298 n=1 Tax=Eriocheir sinensis TaxID=95602 RepID=UPI0021C5C8CA|nr:uncharacterized protein LOC127009298 [Eriocheir sinensis]
MRSLIAVFLSLVLLGAVAARSYEEQPVPNPESDEGEGSHPLVQDDMLEEASPNFEADETDDSDPMMKDDMEEDDLDSEDDETDDEMVEEEEEEEESEDDYYGEYASDEEDSTIIPENIERVASNSGTGESLPEAQQQNATYPENMDFVEETSSESWEGAGEATNSTIQGEREGAITGAEDEPSTVEDGNTMIDEEEDARIKKGKGCKTLSRCTKLDGKCRKKKTGCKKNEKVQANTKNVFCGHKSCECCVKETKKAKCHAKEKCWKQKGTCQSKHKPCHGKLKTGKNFCTGKDCGCCVPAKTEPACKTKYGCKYHKGVCINFAKTPCATTLLVGEQYCKGDYCGCCAPDKPTSRS